MYVRPTASAGCSTSHTGTMPVARTGSRTALPSIGSTSRKVDSTPASGTMSVTWTSAVEPTAMRPMVG